MNAQIRRRIVGIVGGLALLAGSIACGDVALQGRSPSILVIDLLEAAEGDTPGTFTTTLLSDVRTNGSIFNDLGQVTLRIILKDLGAPAAASTPSPLNSVKVTRYRVTFHRADGRNTPGVDVPYGFDGAVTGTITTSAIIIPFEMVRHQAKLEAPLNALAGLGGRVLISTIAEVTFYGTDLAGNDVQATGNLSVNFGDFADPDN